MTGTLSPGSIFDDKYEIVSTLGSGAAGVVYKAKELELDRPVAIKILSLGASQEETNLLLERFKREARVLCQLSHPGILRAYRFGISGQPFLVSELIEGQDLRSILNKEGALRLADCLDFALQIAEALAYAHKEGIVHRDIKPENVLITNQSGGMKCKIIDFGLCKPDLQSGSGRLTATGDLLGTALYMSPEQVKGAAVDKRSDIYSFAIMFFEMLAGYPPLKANSLPETLFKHLNESPPRFLDLNPSCGLPEDIDRIIQQCTEKNPDLRLQSFDELAEALMQVQTSVPDLRFSAGKGSRRSKSKNKLLKLAAPISLASFMLVSLVFAFKYFQTSAAPEQSMELSVIAVKSLIDAGNSSAAAELVQRRQEEESFKRWPPLQQGEYFFKCFEIFSQAGDRRNAQTYACQFLKLSLPAFTPSTKEANRLWDDRVQRLRKFFMEGKISRSTWKSLLLILEDNKVLDKNKSLSFASKVALLEIRCEAGVRSWDKAPLDALATYCKRMISLAYILVQKKEEQEQLARVINSVARITKENNLLSLQAHLLALQAQKEIVQGNLEKAESFMDACRLALKEEAGSGEQMGLKLSSRMQINASEVFLYRSLLDKSLAQKNEKLVARYRQKLAEVLAEENELKGQEIDKEERKGILLESIE